MACLNYRPSVVHFKKGQGGVHLLPRSGGIFYSGGMELSVSVQLPFRKLGFGVYVSVQFRDGTLMLPLFGLKKPLVKKAAKKKAQEVFDSFCQFFYLYLFIPERRFVAGFFRRLLAYLTPHISHTYPAHHTYPTHIHSKRIHHTYPTHIQHIAHIPHISIPNVSHPYVSHQYVSMQCVSIQKVVICIPPITTHIPYISSTSHISHTYPFQTYPFQTSPTNTYPTNTYPCYAYPFNAYPFKRCASAGIANVSHQYISHQYVSSTRIPPVRIHSMRIHSKSLHQQEWQWVWVSLHIISYHCYSAGMVMNIETLLFLQFLCKIINWI